MSLVKPVIAKGVFVALCTDCMVTGKQEDDSRERLCDPASLAWSGDSQHGTFKPVLRGSRDSVYVIMHIDVGCENCCKESSCWVPRSADSVMLCIGGERIQQRQPKFQGFQKHSHDFDRLPFILSIHRQNLLIWETIAAVAESLQKDLKS